MLPNAEEEVMGVDPNKLPPAAAAPDPKPPPGALVFADVEPNRFEPPVPNEKVGVGFEGSDIFAKLQRLPKHQISYSCAKQWVSRPPRALELEMIQLYCVRNVEPESQQIKQMPVVRNVLPCPSSVNPFATLLPFFARLDVIGRREREERELPALARPPPVIVLTHQKTNTVHTSI